jgi:hypothetical protein
MSSGAVPDPHSDAGHLEGDPEGAPRLLVETLAVEEWGDWHGARQITGGSAMVSQPTDLINVAQWSAAHRAGIWRCLFVFKIARPHGEPVAKLAGCH